MGEIEEKIEEEPSEANNTHSEEGCQDSWKHDYLDPEPTVPLESWNWRRKQKRRTVSLYLPSPDDSAQSFSHLAERRLSSAPQSDILNDNSSNIHTSKATPSSPFARGHRRRDSEMPLTGDTPGVRKPDTSQGRFGGWFGGNSSMPAAEAPKSPAANQGRFGFLAQSLNAFTGNTGGKAADSSDGTKFDDELLNINVEAALYPGGSPADRDVFSPAAYKNLHTNATGLLLKMQSAYRQRTIAFQELEAERSAEKEEADEMQLRNENLKMQLEHMANKAEEQEKAMQQLLAELKAERKARNDEATRNKLLAEGSIVNEDLGVDEVERKKWRKSGAKSDYSLDTDDESAESESVFSRSRSPTTITSMTDGIYDTPANGADRPGSLAVPPKSRSPRSRKDVPSFQQFVKNLTGEILPEDDGADVQDEAMDRQRCTSCGNGGANIAWDQVSLLRDENKWLKHRVAQLDVAVEGALDMVNGIGI